MSATARFLFLLFVLATSAVAWPSGQIVQGAPGSQAAAGNAFIAGQVVESPSGRPVPEAMVTMIGRVGGAGGRAMAIPAIIADAQGRFFFRDLRAGVYAVQASKAGYGSARAGLQTTVELAEGERVIDAKVRLARLASITGTLRDAAGDPVVGMEVLVFRRTVVSGRPGLQPIARAIKSDDRGSYRVSGLPAGDYFICACRRDPNPFDPLLLTTLASEPLNLMSVAARALTVGADVVSLDDTLRTYPPTLHPNSATFTRATRVTLAPGDEKSGVDINVELVRATRVSGRVVGAQSPVQASSIRLVPAADAEAGIELTQIQPMLVQPDGRFDFASVPPGQYRLIVLHRETGATAGAPSGLALGFVGSRGAAPSPAPVAIAGPGVTPPPVLWANELIVVGEGGASGLVVSLNPTLAVTGRVQFVGAAQPPAGQVLTRVTIVLQPLVAGGRPAGFTRGQVRADGTFRVDGAVPGRFTVLVNAPIVEYPTLKSVTVGGVDITDLPLEVPAEDVGNVVITLVDTALARLTISSAIPPAAAGTEDDTVALVFPADRKYWTEPAAAQRRFRTLALTTKGTVTAAELPAGEYLVVLATGQDAVDWQEGTRLDALSRRAQRVTLADGDHQTIEVRR